MLGNQRWVSVVNYIDNWKYVTVGSLARNRQKREKLLSLACSELGFVLKGVETGWQSNPPGNVNGSVNIPHAVAASSRIVGADRRASDYHSDEGELRPAQRQRVITRKGSQGNIIH